MAGERTMLAWVRTSLGLMGFGFVVARFGVFLRELAAANLQAPPHSAGVSVWAGTSLVLVGAATAAAAAVQHLRFLRRFDRGEPYRPPRWSFEIAAAVILGAVSVAMAVYLIILQK